MILRTLRSFSTRLLALARPLLFQLALWTEQLLLRGSGVAGEASRRLRVL